VHGSRLLLMNEISEGLAPVIVQKLGDVIRTLMEGGRIVERFEQSELSSQMGVLHEFLGV
jgi:branched-chain amino acid transport system ATP-binding protein